VVGILEFERTGHRDVGLTSTRHRGARAKLK
jgi:hypothetical protein